jgi:HD-GYP domain-containing protein (c-di-GMP phosphodiesterase class II)
MSDPVRFLASFAQALSAMALYGEGHPARSKALDTAYQDLRDLQLLTPQPVFTFLGDETIFGRERLKDFKAWDWGKRLAEAGVQRLEFQDRVSRDEFESFLDEVLARLTLSAIDTADARQMRRSSIKFGAVSVGGDLEVGDLDAPVASVDFSLHDEAETVRWMHDEVRTHGTVPMAEAEALVRSLWVAMHGGAELVMPLLQLKNFDEYTTTHSMNLAVLAMGLAEYLGLGAREVRAFGIAGLLHDLGKVRVPKDVLTKPGKLTEEERLVINRHPADGARIILASEGQLDLAAVVAYEHHILLNGGGYPSLRYPRDCHRASKLVHVCDVYDALRTTRPYRESWPQLRTLTYLQERAGVEFDPDLVTAFTRMMAERESHVSVLHDEQAPLATDGPPPLALPPPPTGA